MTISVWMHWHGDEILTLWADIDSDISEAEAAQHILALVSCRFWWDLVDCRFVTDGARRLWENGELSTIQEGDLIFVNDASFQYGPDGLQETM